MVSLGPRQGRSILTAMTGAAVQDFQPKKTLSSESVVVHQQVMQHVTAALEYEFDPLDFYLSLTEEMEQRRAASGQSDDSVYRLVLENKPVDGLQRERLIHEQHILNVAGTILLTRFETEAVTTLRALKLNGIHSDANLLAELSEIEDDTDRKQVVDSAVNEIVDRVVRLVDIEDTKKEVRTLLLKTLGFR